MKIAVALTLFLAVQPSAALLGIGKLRKYFGKGTMPQPRVTAGGKKLPPLTLDNKDLDRVFAKNQIWKASTLAKDKDFFKKLGTTHTPDYMYIGCSDARVDTNMIMGEDAGAVFVHRNVANMVVNTDTNLLSALQYGVDYLKVKHIIVCGHYECGGMRAAESSVDHGAPLSIWLRNIRDVYRIHKDELNAITDPEARHRRFVDLNVIEQCMNVFRTGVVQKRRKETFMAGEPFCLPQVHAMVFDPKTGELKRLECDFSQYEEEMSQIYGMYQLSEEDKAVIAANKPAPKKDAPKKELVAETAE